MPGCRLDTSLDKVPGCGTARRSSSSSSSHRQRRKHRGPSASADFDLNKENRMQDWLCPSGTSQQPTKAKRKLYCGKRSLLMHLFLAEDVYIGQMEVIHHNTHQSMNCAVTNKTAIVRPVCACIEQTANLSQSAGHSPPATAGRRGAAKRQCFVYQSMPGPSRFDSFEGLSGPPGGPTPHLHSSRAGESCIATFYNK